MLALFEYGRANVSASVYNSRGVFLVLHSVVTWAGLSIRQIKGCERQLTHSLISLDLSLLAGAMGNAFRPQPGPAIYPENKTPVAEDLLEVGLLVAFASIAFSFILIIPGIRGWEVRAAVQPGLAPLQPDCT